jgi:hypothetical protein
MVKPGAKRKASAIANQLFNKTDVNEDNIPFIPIERLEVSISFAYNTFNSEFQQSGINLSDIKKLRDGGFHTVDAIAYAARKEILAVRGMSEQKAERISVSH